MIFSCVFICSFVCIFYNFHHSTRNFQISSSFSLAISVAESLSSESRFYNHRFRHLIPHDVTCPIIHLDALQSGQCFAVIDCMASRVSSLILVKWMARHINMLLWVGLA